MLSPIKMVLLMSLRLLLGQKPFILLAKPCLWKRNLQILPILRVPSGVTTMWPCLELGKMTPGVASLIQNKVGVGFPAAMQSKAAGAPSATFWSDGSTKKIGGAGKTRKEALSVSYLILVSPSDPARGCLTPFRLCHKCGINFRCVSYTRGRGNNS